MRRAHLLAGVTFCAVFALTGAYMGGRFPEAHGGDIGVRFLYRSAHVYIGLAALLNLMAWAATTPAPPPSSAWRRYARLVASALVLASPVAFTLAFFLEPAPEQLERPFAFWGLVTAAGGTLLGCVARAGRGEG